MASLDKRIEELEEATALPPVPTTYDLLDVRMAALRASGASDLACNAFNGGVRWCFLAGPDLMKRALAILDAAQVTDELIGAELAGCLRLGEDGTAYASVIDPEHGESLRLLAIGGLAGDLWDWIETRLKANPNDRTPQWEAASREMLDLLRHESELRTWTGQCNGVAQTEGH